MFLKKSLLLRDVCELRLWYVTRNLSTYIYIYIVLLCIKHFTTYHVCKFGDAVDSKKRKRCVRKPTETEALPLHVDTNDQIKEVVLFDSEYLGKSV